MTWPTERAWKALLATEEDAAAGQLHTHDELDPLLSAWEITESYPGDGISRRRRYHREQPNLPFSYGMRQQLEGPYVIQLCQQIRELHRRLTR